MEFTQLIAQRYSCKNFGAGKVDAAALHTILEAGRLAPTAKNTQEQRIYVVQSEGGAGKDRCCHSLPLRCPHLSGGRL